jgi:hypothetical protein
MEVKMNRNDMKGMPMEAVLLFILAKIDQYKGERDFFENKYKQNFYAVEHEAHSVKGKEDFQLEENLEDWEFAIKSLEYWEKEYHRLRDNAAVA